VLLPPSEGKATDPPRGRRRSGAGRGWDPADGRFGELAAPRTEVVAALAAVGGGDRRLLGVGGDHLELARHSNTLLLGAPAMPAWQRYTGVVWDHLGAATLEPAARRRILVVSGLHGVVRADDQIPYYRLKMSANLAPLGKLSTWWRDPVTDAIERAARRSFVVDLLPREHRAAWRPTRVHGVRVELVDPAGTSGGHFAKAAKGRLTRAILDTGLGALDTWRDDRFVVEVTALDGRPR
jgi:hypothetical protein